MVDAPCQSVISFFQYNNLITHVGIPYDLLSVVDEEAVDMRSFVSPYIPAWRCKLTMFSEMEGLVRRLLSKCVKSLVDLPAMPFWHVPSCSSDPVGLLGIFEWHSKSWSIYVEVLLTMCLLFLVSSISILPCLMSGEFAKLWDLESLKNYSP